MNLSTPNHSQPEAPAAAQREDRRPRNGQTREHPPRPPASGPPQDFLGNRFVYVVLSPRAHGLSVGVDLAPARLCSFDCIYCEVDRQSPPREIRLEVEVMAAELEHTIQYVQSNRLREHPVFGQLPPDLCQLRQVTLSGQGEPTLCSNFVEAVQAVVHLRALGRLPYFKLVLVTNGTGLNLPTVQAGLKYFALSDEIWIKLDVGTQEQMDFINRANVPLETVLDNIRLVGRQRPVVIQSLFAAYNAEEPSLEHIEQYAQRLRELRADGAQIAQVQIYSATRRSHNPLCTHLPLRSLSRIAQLIRCATDLSVEVF